MSTQRVFIDTLRQFPEQEVTMCGWVSRLRVLAKTTFIILKDCSGEMQCVAATDSIKDHHLKNDDVIEIRGKVRPDNRSKYFGVEVDIIEIKVLNRSAHNYDFIVLDFTSLGNGFKAAALPRRVRGTIVLSVTTDEISTKAGLLSDLFLTKQK